jgi:hypothetical protein
MATRLSLPRFQVFGDTGVPLPGAKLYAYSAGTSTPKATYSDAGLTVANPNPVIADAAGRFGDVFLDAGDYKMVLQTSAGVTIWTADPVAGGSTSSSVATSGNNLLINGDFRINQRGNGTYADDAYSLDCWYVLTQSASIAVSQQTAQEAGQAANIRLTQSSATPQRIGLAQIVEGTDSIAARAAAVAMAARLRCSLAQPIRYAILAWTGTVDAVTSDVVADWTSTSYTAGGFFLGSNLVVVATGVVTPAANVWTDAPSITGLMSGSANNLIVMVWTEGVLAQSATLDVGLARLAIGDSAPGFQQIPVAQQMADCTRHFWKTRHAITSSGVMVSGFATTHRLPIAFPAVMRTTPTVAYVGSNNINVSAVDVNSVGATGATFQVTASGSVTGGYSFTIDAGATFDASL